MTGSIAMLSYQGTDFAKGTSVVSNFLDALSSGKIKNIYKADHVDFSALGGSIAGAKIVPDRKSNGVDLTVKDVKVNHSVFRQVEMEKEPLHFWTITISYTISTK